MSVVLPLRGVTALSDFRVEKLLQKAAALGLPEVKLKSEFWYFVGRVPVLRGNTEQYWQASYALMQFIQNDQWMAENITEVLVKPNGEYDFLMRVPTFKVVFGKFEDETLKKANLKAFYKQLEKTNKLNEYSVVNLKYMNQVVCRR